MKQLKDSVCPAEKDCKAVQTATIAAIETEKVGVNQKVCDKLVEEY